MYEISQKQHFIFRTNRLIENIGASHIIRELTTDPRNLFESETMKKHLKAPVFLPKPRYRIVGGGNATFIFDSEEDATTFSRNLSFNILRYFPSIELFLIKRTFDWDKEPLYGKDGAPGLMVTLMNELVNKKNERRHAVKQEAWGIQQACVTSGMPANIKIYNSDTNEKEPRAQEFEPIQDIGKDIRNDGYLKRFIVEENLPPINEEYTFLKQEHLEKVFDKESTSPDGKSYLAIVAIDGNAMGVKVAKFFDQKFANNEDFIQKYEAFTNEIDEAYSNAFRETIAYVMKKYDRWALEFYGDDKNVLEKRRNVIPIRPIIASGDDISFVTYGKLGIEIAKTLLEKLQQQTITVGEKGHTYRYEACAGVAIIRHKYPFWLGIKLADELCSNAKKRLKNDEQKWMERGMGSDEEPYDTSLIDWHLVSHSDMVESIESYRKQYYQNGDGSNLIMRPYYIQHPSDEKKHFASYERVFKQVAINAIQRTKGNEEKRKEKNKMIPSMAKWKNLREVYHEGERAVKQWQILNQFSPSGERDLNDRLFDSYRDGFGLLNDPQDEDGQAFATYYDAIEIFDFFTDLSGEE